MKSRHYILHLLVARLSFFSHSLRQLIYLSVGSLNVTHEGREQDRKAQVAATRPERRAMPSQNNVIECILFTLISALSMRQMIRIKQKDQP